jgi:hypothetical protein
MVYTLLDIREAARYKDSRLSDTKKYPDSWIDDKIEKGFETAESAKQVFYTSETYDITQDIVDGLTEVEIILQKEPHRIYAVIMNNAGLSYEVQGNNHIIIKITPSATEATDNTIKVNYFFYPTLPFTEIEMSPEVYHFFRHCLYVNIYGSLMDKESEQYHQAQVDRFVQEGTFSNPYNFEEEGAIKFGRGSWL